MVLNLLPLPPLDGGRIVTSLLPHRAAWKFSQLERWGFPILLALLFLGVLDTILRPLLWLFNSLIRTLFGF
jgi:Zn-dependent protease